MTSLLENELVLKYFGCCDETPEPEKHTLPHMGWEGAMARRVLRAMQEPIKKGDKIIEWHQLGVIETIAMFDMHEYHPINLRLPQRFQPVEPEKECDGIVTWKDSHCPGCTAKKIQQKSWWELSD